MRFATIDFETATSARNSACAVGVSLVQDWSVVEEHTWLIRPPGNRYNPFNTSIHGLGPADTADSPAFPEVFEEFWPMIQGLPVVAHNAAFDMSVMRYELDAAGIAYPEIWYYCTLLMSRSHWPSLPGYSLPIVLSHCGYTHSHHDAGEDATAAAWVALAIARETASATVDDAARATSVLPGRIKDYWYEPCSSPTGCRPRPEEFRISSIEVAKDADTSHPFWDADIAFTGTLTSMTRPEAMQMVGDRGGRPRTSVSKRTEYLVVGALEYRSMLTGEPSSKMKKALELREQGYPLVVLSEQEFLEYL